MAVWAVVGISLFWLGWPWLWHDSWSRVSAFWGTGVTRATLMVTYFGRVIADREVPWHYPWFYFAVTVPIGLQALGALGIGEAGSHVGSIRFRCLWSRQSALFLGLFSTRVPVYDGERLFLNVFPAWALLIGFGFGWLWDHGLSTFRRRIALGAFVLAQSFGLVPSHPFGLSYYNGLVGGLPGAEWLGLELTYWNDPVDQVLLDQLAREAMPGASAALVPTLYQGQGILTTNRRVGANAGSSSRTKGKRPGANGSPCRDVRRTGVLKSGNVFSEAEAERLPPALARACGCPHSGISLRE